jgi:hypothetical protein
MMCMRPYSLAAAACFGILFVSRAGAGPVPPDMRAGHWATSAVTRTLDSGVLRLQSDGKFHGDAKVTRSEALAAVSALGHALLDGTWKAGGRSRPVPDSVAAIWQKTSWKTEPVRRYAFAAILTRFGDYIANGLPRPSAGANVGQSIAIPTVDLKLPETSPDYPALSFLAHNRMITTGSALMKPDATPLLGGDLSRALAELAIGLNDRLTDLGKTANGETHDEAFHKPNGH